MQELKELWENGWTKVIVVLFCVFVGSLIFKKALVHSTAQEVIEMLRKDYVPGPYDPGFDPDKVNPDLWKKHESTLRELQWRDSPDAWNEQWEAQRSD
jgi:hypothetical protein